MAEKPDCTEFYCGASGREGKDGCWVLALTWTHSSTVEKLLKQWPQHPAKQNLSDRHLNRPVLLVGFSLGMYFKQGNRISLQFSTPFSFCSHGSSPVLNRAKHKLLWFGLCGFSRLGFQAHFSRAQKPAGTRGSHV